VRAIGRNMKRLIDAAVDVSEIQHRLLDPSFDVEAWLERKRLVERPAGPRKTTVFAEASIKRTQAFRLGGQEDTGALSGFGAPSGTVAIPTSARAAERGPLLTAPIASRGGPSGATGQSGQTTAIPSGPRRTRLLSIGLHAEAAPETRSSLPPIDARLELSGRALPLQLPVINLGQSSECQISLPDPALSAFHAQIVRHAAGLYIRDLGSSSGTWVNGQALFGPHPLRDGDVIRLGQQQLLFRASALPQLAAKEQKHIGGPRLEVRSGGSFGLSFALGAPALLLGSAPDCGMRLTDPSISPHHAELRSAGGTHTVTDLESYGGSTVRGTRLAPRQPYVLLEGDWLRFGAVDVLYSTAWRVDALASLQPSARVSITSGSDSGKSAAVGDRLLVGGDPGSGLHLSSVSGPQLELCLHGGRFWVRDLSGGRAFRAGSPLAKEFSEIAHGDLLLLAGTVMLRFEEGT